MDLVTPGIGLLFWMLLAFTLLFLLLKKYAWKPVLKMLHERDEHIAQSLKAAEQARIDMQMLQQNNEKILAEARRERDLLLAEARQVKEKMINDARQNAQIEASKMIDLARLAIQKEKQMAILDMKNKIAEFSVEVAGKILRKELSAENRQNEYLTRLIDELNIN